MQPGSVCGVVLAGGRSRRMGGSDKTAMELGGSTVLGQVYHRLQKQVPDVVINGAGDVSRWGLGPVMLAPDDEEVSRAGDGGPLAGILAGMRWCATYRPSARWIVSVPGDTPFIPPELSKTLAQIVFRECRMPSLSPIALACSAIGRHPAVGCWPCDLQDDLAGAIRSGVRRIMEWATSHGYTDAWFPALDVPGGTVDPFFNINTRENLDQGREISGLLDTFGGAS